MKKSRLRLLQEARGLADTLAVQDPPVKASTLRSLTADFVASPLPDKARLLRLLKQVAAGKGGHLQRTGTFPDQALRAVEVLRSYLEASKLDAGEVRTILGWAGRLLLVDRRGQGRASNSAGRRSSPQPPQRSRLDPEPTISKPRPTAKMGAVKGKGMDALAAFKEGLVKKEKGEP